MTSSADVHLVLLSLHAEPLRRSLAALDKHLQQGGTKAVPREYLLDFNLSSLKHDAASHAAHVHAYALV